MVELVRDFVNRDVKPVVRELEHANTYPEKLIDQMKQLGIFGLAIPEPWGDAQVSTSCYARITEELARGWMSLAGAMGGHTVVAKLILTFGTDQQKDTYLPRMATGELRATMALTEPGGGSDLQALRTVARRVKETHRKYLQSATSLRAASPRAPPRVLPQRFRSPKQQQPEPPSQAPSPSTG